MPPSPAPRPESPKSAAEVVINPTAPEVEAEAREKAESAAEVSATLGGAPEAPETTPSVAGAPEADRESAVSKFEAAFISHRDSIAKLSENAKLNGEEMKKILEEKEETKGWFYKMNSKMVLAQDALEQGLKINDAGTGLSTEKMGKFERFRKSFVSALTFGWRRWVVLARERKATKEGAKMLQESEGEMRELKQTADAKKQINAKMIEDAAKGKAQLSAEKAQMEKDLDLPAKKSAFETAAQREKTISDALTVMKDAKNQAADLKRKIAAETDETKKAELEEQLGEVKKDLLAKMKILKDAGVVPTTKAGGAGPDTKPVDTKTATPDAGAEVKVEMTAEERKNAEGQLDAMKQGIVAKEQAANLIDNLLKDPSLLPLAKEYFVKQKEALDVQLKALRAGQADLEKKLAPPAVVETKGAKTDEKIEKKDGEKKDEEKAEEPEATATDPDAAKKIEDAKKAVEDAEKKAEALGKDVDTTRGELDAATKGQEEARRELEEAKRKLAEKQAEAADPSKHSYHTFHAIGSKEGKELFEGLPNDEEVSLMLGTQKPGEHAEFVGTKDMYGKFSGRITVTVGGVSKASEVVKNASIDPEQNGWWKITPENATPYVFFDISKKSPAPVAPEVSDAVVKAKAKLDGATNAVTQCTTTHNETQARADTAKTNLDGARKHLDEVNTPKTAPPAVAPPTGVVSPPDTATAGSADTRVTDAPTTDTKPVSTVESADAELDAVDGYLDAGDDALAEAKASKEKASVEYEEAKGRIDYIDTELGKLDGIEKGLREQEAHIDAWVTTTVNARAEAIFARIQKTRGGQIGKVRGNFMSATQDVDALKKAISDRLSAVANGGDLASMKEATQAFRGALGTSKRKWMAMLNVVSTIGFVRLGAYGVSKLGAMAISKALGGDVAFHAGEFASATPVDAHAHVSGTLVPDASAAPDILPNAITPDAITPEGTLWDTIQHHGGAVGEHLSNAETLARQGNVVDAINSNPDLVNMLGHKLTVTPDAFGQFGSAGKLTAEQLSTLVSDPTVAQAIHGGVSHVQTAAEAVQSAGSSAFNAMESAGAFNPTVGPHGLGESLQAAANSALENGAAAFKETADAATAAYNTVTPPSV